MRIEMNLNHMERIARGNARVAAKKASVESDPLKPIFHIMPEAGSCGDPNGAVYAKGKYHMFFQHSPEFEWGKPVEQLEESTGVGGPGGGHPGVGWGHVSSVDGVYWEHEPIALMAERGSYDPTLCASGCTVVADDGTPTIFYTAAEPQTQCIARSQDPNLRYWLKDKNNPIIREPNIDNFNKGGFRDPFIWREGSTWQMIVCGSIRGVGGMAVHFRSENLTDWSYVGPFATGMGEHCVAWECPNFMRFKDMGVLVVSPLFDNVQDKNYAPRSSVVYSIAPYSDGGTFVPGTWKAVDFGGPNNFYAGHNHRTPDGRYWLWGMVIGGGSPGHDWVTHLTLPRVISLRPDGLLGQEPPVELQGLRRSHWSETNLNLVGNHLLGIKSSTFEIIAEIEISGATSIGMDIRASDDFTSKTRLVYDVLNSKLNLDGFNADFKLLPGEDVLRLHAFVDRSVVEAFTNRRECGTVRAFQDINNQAIRLFSEGGTARIRSVDVWEMGSIWERPKETK